MILVLEVIRHHGLAPSMPKSARFGERGGSIGLNEGNHMVLPDADKLISRFHANIHYFNGRFQYEDHSTNGTYLCGESRVLLNDSVFLGQGDRLIIGEYELQAHIQVESEYPPHPIDFGSNGVGISGPFAEIGRVEVNVDSFEPPIYNGRIPSGVVDFPKPISNQFGPELDEPWPAPWGHEPVKTIEEQWPMQLAVDAGEKKLEAFDDGIEKKIEPSVFVEEKKVVPPKPDVKPPHRPDAEVDFFQCFLEGAGLKLPPDLSFEEQVDAMKSFGFVFRHAIDGVMALLRVRSEQKSEMRVDVTLVRAGKNNPLKFIPDSEQAINVMLYKKYREKSYLDPETAIREAFLDIRNHEIAMQASIKASLLEILEKFNPESFDESSAAKGVFQSKKAKCWEAYCEAYPDLVSEATEGLFKGGFVEAYEAQVRRLNEANDEN